MLRWLREQAVAEIVLVRPGIVVHRPAIGTGVLALHARVPNFPDPGTFMPSTPPAYGTVDKINGAVFVIPGSIDLQAPAVQEAASACKFPGGLE